MEEVGPSIFEDNLSAIALEREKEEEWNKKGLGSGMNPIDYQKKKRDNISKTMAGIMKTTLQAIAAETKLSDALKQRDTIKAQGTTERKIKFQGEDDFDVNQATKLTEEVHKLFFQILEHNYNFF